LGANLHRRFLGVVSFCGRSWRRRECIRITVFARSAVAAVASVAIAGTPAAIVAFPPRCKLCSLGLLCGGFRGGVTVERRLLLRCGQLAGLRGALVTPFPTAFVALIAWRAVFPNIPSAAISLSGVCRCFPTGVGVARSVAAAFARSVRVAFATAIPALAASARRPFRRGDQVARGATRGDCLSIELRLRRLDWLLPRIAFATLATSAAFAVAAGPCFAWLADLVIVASLVASVPTFAFAAFT